MEGTHVKEDLVPYLAADQNRHQRIFDPLVARSQRSFDKFETVITRGLTLLLTS